MMFGFTPAMILGNASGLFANANSFLMACHNRTRQAASNAILVRLGGYKVSQADDGTIA